MTSLVESKSTNAVLCIDHLEEVFTQCQDISEQEGLLIDCGRQSMILAFIVTLLPYDPIMNHDLHKLLLKDVWQKALVTIPPFSLEQLMETGHAYDSEVMIFDPPNSSIPLSVRWYNLPERSLYPAILNELYLTIHRQWSTGPGDESK